VDWRDALAFVARQKLLQAAAGPVPAKPSAVKKLGGLKNFRELHPEFPGMGNEEQN
jgi:hypothetical protein